MPKSDNLFAKIKLATNEPQIESPLPLSPIIGESNPKKRLLHDIATMISESEKRSLLNHTAVKVKATKDEVLAGNKVSKLLGIKKHTVKTKEHVRNHYDMGIYARDQTTRLLKNIKKRVESDKSEPFNFDAFNADIKALHGHHQDKVMLHGALQDHKGYNKSIKRIQQKLKKAQELEGQLHAGENMLNSASDRIKGYKANILEWQKKHPKPKSKLDKAIDLITEPLIPPKGQRQQGSNRGVSRSSEKAKKPNTINTHSFVDSMRRALNKNANNQDISGSVAPDTRVSSAAKGQGIGR